MAMELSVVLVCAKILGIATGLGFGVLLLAGAVNCRIEADYWDRFWAETPVACLGSSASERGEIIDSPAELLLAA